MDRLSGLDASFLYLETPAQLMHVCGLIVLDPSTMPEPYSFAAMRDGIEARVRDVPDFTRKLRRVPLGLDHPVWVRDTQFDIERHVHRLALPTPGGYAELTELAGHLAGLPLDRSRPLWEMWVIEGYKGEDGRDLIAVFQKMHHATVDGVSGANLISHLCSLEPDAEPLGAQEEKKAWPHEPGRGELLGRGAGHQLHPAVHDRRPAGADREGRGRHHRPRPRRYGDGGPADRSAHVVQRHHHRPPRDRARPDGPRHHQGGQGRHRHHRQRRGSRRGRRRAALLPRGPRRAARQLAARDRAGLGPLGVEALRAPTRSRRSSPGSAPTSRTRWSGSRTWPPPTATPRSTTRRSAPTHCRTGPSSRRRARSGSRSARTPRSAWPSGTRWCTTW